MVTMVTSPRVSLLITDLVAAPFDDLRVRLPHHVVILVRVLELAQDVAHRINTGTLLVVGLDGHPRGFISVGVAELLVLRYEDRFHVIAVAVRGDIEIFAFAQPRSFSHTAILPEDRLSTTPPPPHSSPQSKVKSKRFVDLSQKIRRDDAQVRPNSAHIDSTNLLRLSF